MASWVVHVVHVAVPCGDGAIYLYCKQDPAHTKPIVHRAVLIDGGRSMEGGRDALLEVIERINNQYDFSENANFEDPYPKEDGKATRSLRFDSIVITHWDEDHHLGVQGLLAQGYEKSFEKYGLTYKNKDKTMKKTLNQFCQDVATKKCIVAPVKPSKKRKKGSDDPPPRDDIDKFKNGAVFLPCWYCKYGYDSLQKKLTADDEPVSLAFEGDRTDVRVKIKGGLTNYDNLKTTLYVPCSVSQAFVGPFRHGSGDSHRYLRNIGDLGGYTNTTDFGCFFYNFSTRVNIGDMKDKKKGKAIDVDPFPPAKWSNHLVFPWFAKVEDKFANYIGTNLFTGSKLPTADYKLPKSPSELVTSHKLDKDTPIGFFIVAGHQRIIGGSGLLDWKGLTSGESSPGYLGLPPLPADPIVKPDIKPDVVNDKVHVLTRRAPAILLEAEGKPLRMPSSLKEKNNTAIPLAKNPVIPGVMATGITAQDLPHMPGFELPFHVLIVEEKNNKLGGKPPAESQLPLTDAITKNAVSITTLVISWKEQAAPENYEILHFAGGDVDWDVEGGLINWLANGRRVKGKDEDWMCRPKVWKLNHHGSRKETAINLLNIMCPDYYVCSSSEDGEYGHPSPETLMMIWSQFRYFQTLYKNDKRFVQKPWLCTAYPKWLASMDGLSSITFPIVNGFNPDNKEAKTKESSKAFQAAVKKRTAKCDTSDKEPFEAVKTKIKETQKAWADAKTRPSPPSKISEVNFDSLWAVRELMVSRWTEIAPKSCQAHPYKPTSFWFKLEAGKPAHPQSTQKGTPAQRLSEDEIEVETVAPSPPTDSSILVEEVVIASPKDGGSAIEEEKEEREKEKEEDPFRGPKFLKAVKTTESVAKHQDESDKIVVDLGTSGDKIAAMPDLHGEDSDDDDPEAEFDKKELEIFTKPTRYVSYDPLPDHDDLSHLLPELLSPRLMLRTSAVSDGLDVAGAEMLESSELETGARDVQTATAAETVALDTTPVIAAPGSGGTSAGDAGPLPITVKAPASPAANEPLALYLLVSSAFTGPTFQYDKARFAMLTRQTVFDTFVRRLPNGFIVVARAKNSPEATTSETLKLVAPADRWGKCLVPGALGIKSVDLTCSISPVSGSDLFQATVSAMAAQVRLSDTLELSFKSDVVSNDTVSAAKLESQLVRRNALLYLPVDLADGVMANKVFSLPELITLLAPQWFKADFGTGVPDKSGLKLSTRPEARSGLYLVADRLSSVCMRLDFDATAVMSEMLDWLGGHDLLPFDRGQLGVEALTFTVMQQCSGVWSDSRCRALRDTFCQVTGTFKISSEPVEFRIRLNPGEAKLSVRFPNTLAARDVFSWLSKTLKIDKDAQADLSEDKVKDLAPVPDNSTPTGDKSTVDLGLYKIELLVGKGAGWNCTATMRLRALGATFIASVSFPNLRVRADRWTEVIENVETVTYLPWFDDWTVYIPPTIGDLENEVKLEAINTDMTTAAPHSDFLTLIEAHFEAARQPGGGVNIEIFARIYLSAPRLDSPMLWPQTFSVRGTYGKTLLGASQWQIVLDSVLYLPRKVGDGDQLPARLELTGMISNSSWSFAGTAANLDFMSMYSYFDADARDTILDLLSGIGIPWITLQYDHSKTASTLSIDGCLQIKKFALDFSYQHYTPRTPEGGTERTWQMTAGLRRADAKPGHTGTLLDIITAFIPGDDESALQDDTTQDLAGIPFIDGLVIEPSVSVSNLDPITFRLQSSKRAVIMWLRVEMATAAGSLSVLFMQYKRKTDAKRPGPGEKPRAKGTNVKRYIRVRFDKLPTLHNVPIVGDMPPPIDSLDYVYIKDNTVPSPDAKSYVPGLYPDEIAEMNEALESSIAIMFKEQRSGVQATSKEGFSKDRPGMSTSSPVADVKPALRAGHHFVAMSDGAILLDHLFGSSTAPGPKPPVGGGGNAVASPVQAESGSTFGAHKKSASGLSITGVGLKVKDSHIYILIDGSIRLGPIEVAAEGLGIGIPLGKIAKPKDLVPDDFKLMLSGLGIMYNQPPILIAGGFKLDIQPNYESYLGGLLITIPPYSVTAVGAYRATKNPEFKSVFIYGRLDGPLFTLEFAEISGVAVSFGYNYSLRSPSTYDVENFPLLSRQPAGPGARDPLDMMIGSDKSSFSSWLQAEKETFYFSVGLKADALQVLTIEAALIFGLGSGGLKASLVGRATAQMPPAATKSPDTFLYAELGLVATLDVGGGSFVVEASLSSNSFVLAPACRIQGGFALAYWFGSSAYAGDWVFTVGGYHPAFQAPKHWPMPPRVGIAWEVSDVLRVGGEGFFAITPRAVMGGAHIFATFNAGLIYADFAAWVSFLLNYKPLFFVAEIGFSITVGARINLGIIHIDINGSVYADLCLRGPPFGGYVDVDFKLVHFKIYFGEPNPKPKALSFDAFIDAVKNPGLTAPADTTAGLVIIALSAGAATERQATYDQPTGGKWFVRAGAFRFRVESKFAIRTAEIDSDISGTKDPRNDAEKLGKQLIYARLTQGDKSVDSNLTVKISRGSPNTGKPWRVLPIDKSLPKAMWGQYSAAEDPTYSDKGKNDLESILGQTGVGDSTISHIVGYHFVPPESSLPDKAVTFPIFNAVEAMSEGVFQEHHTSAATAKLKNPLIPKPTGGDTHDDKAEKRPRLPPAAAKDSSPTPGTERVMPDLHNDKKTIWHSADDADTQELADWVSAAYGWKGAPAVIRENKAIDDPSPAWHDYECKDILSGWSLLEGAAPRRLIDDFDQYYMSYPFVSTA